MIDIIDEFWMSDYELIDRHWAYYTIEEDYWSTGGRTGMLPKWITPSRIYRLGKNEIFVFGTGHQGRHDAGASLYAVKHFGAIVGQSEGLQGQSYAIISTGSLEEVKQGVERFTQFAREHTELTFYVTPIGCSYGGHVAEEIAPMFREAANLPNVYLPLIFWKVFRNVPSDMIRKQYIDYVKEKQPELFYDDMRFKRIKN